MPTPKWTNDTNATPPMFFDLKVGRKTVATVRRVAGQYVKRKNRQVYQHRYQVVQQWVGGCGHAIGPVFTSLAAAKREAEKAL